MFRLLKMRTKRRVDEFPWQAARKDDVQVAPVNVSEMEIESEKDEMIMMDMNRTTWVALTSEDVVDLRLNGERLGTTAFACFDRKLRVRRARQNTCMACKEFHQNNENAMFQKSKNASNTIQHPVTLNLDNSNESIAISDYTDSSSNSSFELIDQDLCLSGGDSSDYSEHHWDSSQEGDSAASSLLAFNHIEENKRADFISNLKKLSHNCNQHASYLCPVCNVQYAPKDYFNLHLMKVHGMVSVDKNSAIDSNNDKNIDGAMSSHAVEPGVSNQISILRRRRANSIGRHISVKTHSTCESYSNVLHKCPFCEAPYLLKNIARHFEEMHADDLKLFKRGKDQLVVQQASYLCPVCNVQYAPKEYFNLHLMKVHGMVSVDKNAANDSNNNKNIDGAMSSHAVEPDVSNQSSILRRRRANSIGRHISVKTHSTCESYSNVIHKCPFCEAPYLLKHIARHFEEMHANDLKLFKRGKDRLVVQPVNCKKRILENECTITEDVVDQNSYPETHKKKFL